MIDHLKYSIAMRFAIPCCFMILVATVFISCEDWNLKEEVFLQVFISTPESISIDSVKLEGYLQDYTGGQIETHGFIWTTQDQDLTINSREGITDLFVKTQDDPDLNFTAQIELKPNQRYQIRAFASLDRVEYVYSEVIEYQTGNAQVFTEDLNYDAGMSLEASGRLSGMDKGFVALEHGFCWSTENPNPTRDDNIVNLGDNRSNDPFTAAIAPLTNNKRHYFRAYAVISQDLEVEVLYGDVLEFDGDLEFWEEKADIGFNDRRYNCVGFSIADKAYIGIGSSGTTLLNDFWSFDPETNVWTQVSDFEGGFRTDAIAFSLGGQAYVGCGSDFEDGITNDLWAYDPNANQWIRKADLPGPARFGAVAVTIADKAYVGTGQTDNDQYLSDWWEYNPQNDEWTQKSDFEGDGRLYALSFEAEGEAFVGTGHKGSFADQELYHDLWSYNPGTDSWSEKARFEGGDWVNAVAFSIDNIGYTLWGQGSNRSLWSYKPDTDTWLLVRDLPIGPRNDATGFTIGQKAYFGFGTFNLMDQRDLWEYDP